MGLLRDKWSDIPDSKRAYIHRNRARDHLEIGDYNRAIEELDEALLLNPDHSDSYFNRAFAHYALGEYQLAIQDLDVVIRSA